MKIKRKERDIPLVKDDDLCPDNFYPDDSPIRTVSPRTAPLKKKFDCVKLGLVMLGMVSL